MTTITLISLLATLSILLLIAIFLFLTWHKKRQSLKQFEQLLADITDQQNTRSEALTRRFTDKLHADPTDAQSLSKQLITAEKLFLQYFINQQIQQQPLDDFYTRLCDLLDSYFSITPKLENTQATAPTNSATIPNPENLATDQNVKPSPDSEPEPEPEPDWGDVFD